jgi:flavin-dependent dehydrogenase
MAAIAAKQSLGKRGDVVVIERKAYDDHFSPIPQSGEKACAGAVPQRGLKIMDQHGVPWREIPHAPVDRLVVANLGTLNNLSPDGVVLPRNPHFENLDFPNYGAVFERGSFDARLLQSAHDAGALVYTGSVVETITQVDGGFSVVFRKGEEKHTMHIPMLIGAFGANPLLSKRFAELLGNPQTNFDETATTAYRAYVPYEACPIQRGEIRGDIFTFNSGDGLHFGYRWFFGGANSVNIGVGTFLHGKDGRIEQAAIRKFFPEISDKFAIRGSPLPIWEPGRREFLWHGGSAVGIIGDAAGLIDPITGEGIREAMESGAKLGTAMAESILSGTSIPLRYLAFMDQFSTANATRVVSHILSHRVTEDPELLGNILSVMERHPELGSILFHQPGTESPVFKRALDIRLLAVMAELISDKKIRAAILATIRDPLWRQLLPSLIANQSQST